MTEVEVPRLVIGGDEYAGWTSLIVSRGIERAAASFRIELTERWPGRQEDWRILPGDACELYMGDDLVVTGHVEQFRPTFEAEDHFVRVGGRSKTGDLIDSSAVVRSGQFKGYDLQQIAEALAEPFGIEVEAEVDVGEPFDDVQVQQGESVFDLIERLCRMRALLATDTPDGALRLTQAGEGRAEGALIQGDNILRAAGDLDWSRRHSHYIVKGQAAGNDQRAGEAAAQPVAEQRDPAIERHRPLIIVAESGIDDADAEKRARWEAKRRAGRAVRANIEVQGWRQTPGGRLWTPNEMVSVDAPWLGLSREMLVTEVVFQLSEIGTVTTLQLGLPDAFKPEPVTEDADDEPAPAAPEPMPERTRGMWDDVQPIPSRELID